MIAAFNACTIDERLAADAEFLMTRYETDIAHCGRVQHHAALLFSIVMESLVENEEEGQALWTRLALAALLHDIGHFVADTKHHRHSRYLILHDERTRTWDESMRMDVAALAFTHRRAIKQSWIKKHFHGSKRLFQLAAILRVADGLDRSHADGVRIVQGKMAIDRFEISVSGLPPKDARHLSLHKTDAWVLAFGQPIQLMMS